MGLCRILPGDLLVSSMELSTFITLYGKGKFIAKHRVGQIILAD